LSEHPALERELLANKNKKKSKNLSGIDLTFITTTLRLRMLLAYLVSIRLAS
jgi:hypothetical protein